ncbi:hypothetical protein ASD80_09100 [Devosia sp. Root635]|nr:hypothetical protein ASD80_09100 [Devosia sp. Root635]
MEVHAMQAHEADPGVLAHCAAIVVAHDEPDTAALISLGEKVGFGVVSGSADFAGNDWHIHRILFFLVHYGIGMDAKRQLLDRVRHAGSVNICFAPVVLFLQDGPGDEMLEYIEMGFDDVICLPENSHIVSTRLASQIGQEQTYIETRRYLGPDRRRMELPGHSHPERTGDQDHTNLTLLRTPEMGVQILRRQLIVKARPV